MMAIAHGKPVLCEKPMGMNAGECKQMVESARSAQVLLGVAQVFRFEDSTARLRERVASGQIGRPVFARSEFSYPANHHKRTWLTDPALAGGGPIADVGVHCVDALRYVLDDEVVRVMARGMWDARSGGVEAAAALSLEFARGTLGTVMVSMRADYRTPMEFVGEEGVLRADDGLNVERPINLQLRRNGAVVENETVSNQYAYARQVDMFAAAVQGEAAFPVPGEEGWQNQEILDAAFRSLHSGKAEEVPRVVASRGIAR
jgi:predicted dehydrogenase